MKVKDVKEVLLSEAVKVGPLRSKDLLSTGSTVLNLALSGKPRGGFYKGLYFFIVGDSGSGKTFLNLTCLAEAAINPAFDDYRLIIDDGEEGANMDLSRYFPRAAARIEHHNSLSDPPCSYTLEEFYDRLDDLLDSGEKFIYVRDSLDALPCRSEIEYVKKQRKARAGGQKEKGSYGGDRPKISSARMRTISIRLKKTGSILIVIGQSRDRIGYAATFDPKTRAGGHAPTFYCQAELWTSVRRRLYRLVNGKKRQIGIVAKVKIKKNRLTGKSWEAEVPIYWSTGIDDVGGMIDFLVSEKHWKGSDKSETVTAPEFDFKGSKEKLIAKVIRGRLGPELKKVVRGVWAGVEAACQVERENPYA